MIPILELTTQYAAIKDEVLEAVARVLARTHYILGPEGEAFESEFGAWVGSPHAVGVASGTDALILALRALGVGAGDEVICPTFTFIATAGAAALTGARPVFCDIQPDTFNLDPKRLEACITPRTKAIVVVHLYGHPADMQPILEIAARHGIPVVEDCAQAAGAEIGGQKVGTFGVMGCFSFFPSKNLGAAGDAGLITCASEVHAAAIRKLRGHGSSKKYFHDVLGTNSRLDEVQAAVLRVKLKYLDRWNEARRAVAKRYNEGLQHVVVPPERPGMRHVYHQYTIRTPERDALMAYLGEQGITSVIYYPVSLHQQEVFHEMGHRDGDFPEAEKAQREVLSLPMFPELSPEQSQQVISAVGRFHEARVAKAG